eukprot:1160400-Pelagomonas_calceolata.AAC.8
MDKKDQVWAELLAGGRTELKPCTSHLLVCTKTLLFVPMSLNKMRTHVFGGEATLPPLALHRHSCAACPSMARSVRARTCARAVMQVWEGVPPCLSWPTTTPAKLPLHKRGTLAELEHLLSLYDRGDMPTVEWLDPLVIQEIQKLQQQQQQQGAQQQAHQQQGHGQLDLQGQQDVQGPQLLITLPSFPQAVLYQQPASAAAVTQAGAAAAAAAASSGAPGGHTPASRCACMLACLLARPFEVLSLKVLSLETMPLECQACKECPGGPWGARNFWVMEQYVKQ